MPSEMELVQALLDHLITEPRLPATYNINTGLLYKGKNVSFPHTLRELVDQLTLLARIELNETIASTE